MVKKLLNSFDKLIGFFILSKPSSSKVWAFGLAFGASHYCHPSQEAEGLVSGLLKWGSTLFQLQACTLDVAFGGFTLWLFKSRGGGHLWPKIWTLGLAFGGFTQCPQEDSKLYILLSILSTFLSTLNKVRRSNPTAGTRLGRVYFKLVQLDLSCSLITFLVL